MKYKFAFVSIAISFFTLQAHSGRYSCFLKEFQNEPRVTFTWKTKCTTYAAIYACRGGFKSDAASLKEWQKDSQTNNEVYELTQTLGNVIGYDIETDKINPILEKSCPSGCYGKPDLGFEFSQIETCTKPDEQVIHFSVSRPNHGGGSGAWIYCNASGGTALLKEFYPKAKWEHHPTLPHYYHYNATTDGEANNLMDLFHDLRGRTKGCHLQKWQD